MYCFMPTNLKGLAEAGAASEATVRVVRRSVLRIFIVGWFESEAVLSKSSYHTLRVVFVEASFELVVVLVSRVDFSNHVYLTRSQRSSVGRSQV